MTSDQTPEQLAETVRGGLSRGSGKNVEEASYALSELVRLAGEADTLRRELDTYKALARQKHNRAVDAEAERDRLREEVKDAYHRGWFAAMTKENPPDIGETV